MMATCSAVYVGQTNLLLFRLFSVDLPISENQTPECILWQIPWLCPRNNQNDTSSASEMVAHNIPILYLFADYIDSFVP